MQGRVDVHVILVAEADTWSPQVPGYTRKDDNNTWLYSDKVSKMLAEYTRRSVGALPVQFTSIMSVSALPVQFTSIMSVGALPV